MLQQMAELGLLGFEIFLVVRVRFRSNRHLLNHFEPVTFQPDHFFGIVRQESELAHAEIEQDLRTESVIAQIRRQAEFHIRFDRVESFLLQFVGVNLCR